MNIHKRDIILLVKTPHLQSLEREINALHLMIENLETKTNYCRVFELVDRNRITSGKIKILEFLRERENKPFRFLINKN